MTAQVGERAELTGTRKYAGSRGVGERYVMRVDVHAVDV